MSEHPDPSRWWKHRRRGYYAGMAWTAITTVAWVLIGFKSTETLASLSTVIGWSYGVAATLIVAYFGNTAAETIITKGAR